MSGIDTLKNITGQLDTLHNNTACVYVDHSIEAILNMKNTTYDYVHDANELYIPIGIIFASLIGLFFGARLFRPVAAISAFVLSFYGIYHLSESSENLGCSARIGLSAIVALIAALATGCLIKLSLFIIGAASFGGLIHFIFTAFPELHDIGDMPIILHNSLLYYIVIILGGIFGGFLLRWNEKISLEIMTSLISGAGFTFGLHGVLKIAEVDISNAIFVGIAITSSSIGVLVQRKLRHRRKNKKMKKSLTKSQEK